MIQKDDFLMLNGLTLILHLSNYCKGVITIFMYVKTKFD